MAQRAYFRVEHSSFNRGDWGYGRVAAAARYAANENKKGHVVTVGLPFFRTSYDAERAFLALERQSTRKNARLGDTLIVSLPVGLSDHHQLTLMERFLDRITFGGRTYAQAWQHTDKPHNPHFHVVLVDKDRLTGKSVGKFGHSRSYRAKQGLEPNVTEWMRKQWEETGNELFSELGYDLSFDRRSNAEIGLEQAGEHRGYENDNQPVDESKALPTLPETEDIREDEDAVETVTFATKGYDAVTTLKQLHSEVANLEYLNRSVQAMKDAEERYQYLVEQREKVTAEAGAFQQESLPILMTAYSAKERLAEHQTQSGELKGRAFGLFGYTLFRTSARKSAEEAQFASRQAELEANRVNQTRASYDMKVNTLSNQASQAEQRAYTHRAELESIYGTLEEAAQAKDGITNGIRDSAASVSLGEAVTAYAEGQITEEEYRTFLTEGGYGQELAILNESTDYHSTYSL